MASRPTDLERMLGVIRRDRSRTIEVIDVKVRGAIERLKSARRNVEPSPLRLDLDDALEDLLAISLAWSELKSLARQSSGRST